MKKLNNSFTTFIKAYQADQAFLAQVKASPMWNVSEIKPDAAFLFNHVYEFFAHNSGRTELDRNQAVVFELCNNPGSEREKESMKLWNTFFSREHTIAVNEGEYRFRLEKGSGILSPTLIFVPLTGIVLISYTIRLKAEEQELSKLLALNYNMRVSFRGSVCKISTMRRDHPNARESEELVAGKLEALNEYEPGEDSFIWTVNTLIDYLVSELETSLKDLSPARLQAFTYVNFEDEVEDDAFDDAMFRLRRIYSEKYQPARSFIERGDEVTQTFEKVVYGASVEGAAVVIKSADEIFLRNYESTVVQRTLWTYLLAFHQRMALISAAQDTNALFRDNSEPSTIQLTAIVDRLIKLQLKGLFEEISHYSQQNDFYYLVYRNLRIDELFKEVKDEVDEINLMLTERWRRNEELNHRIEEERNKKNQRVIETLLALFILPQVWFALLSTNVEAWQNTINEHQATVDIINAVIWVIIIWGVARVLWLSRKGQKVVNKGVS